MGINTDSTDDSLLWKAFLRGDEAAFTQLYDRYVRILYSYGLKMQPDPAVVEDAVQDLFVDLWRLRHGLSETDSVKFYLFRSLRRRLHRALRPNEQPLQDVSEHLTARFAAEPSAEQTIITTESAHYQTNRIQVWLDSLPARQQEVLLLRYYQDFSYPQIAALLEINEQSARNLVQKALHKLRRFAFLTTLVLLMDVLKTFF